MFRVQPSDPFASSGPGVGGRQRLGRADAVHARGEHPSAEAWQPKGLGGASLLPVASRAGLLRPATR